MSGDGDSASLRNWDDKIQELLEQGRRLGSVDSNYAANLDTRPQLRRVSDDVSRLKEEIDEQNRKTMELQHEIMRATENFRSSVPRQTFLSNMNNNNNVTALIRPSTGGGLRDYSAPYEGTRAKEHLERALEDSQEQVRYLTKKLEDSQETAEKQKVQFRTSVEELQMKLQETIAGRKQLVKLRETEMEERDEMIHKLQNTVKDLAAANQIQEQSLNETMNRMHLVEKHNQVIEKALERVRCIFSSHDKIKGKSNRLTESDRLSDVSAEYVADAAERAMNDLYEEIEAMRNKIMELENEICDTKRDHDREVNLLSVKQQEAAEMLRIETNERVLEERLNTESAVKQVHALQDESQQQKIALVSKDQEIRDIEKEMTIITTQFEELKNHYFDDKESLQNKVIDIEGKLASRKQTNETYKQECEKLKLQLAESQQHFLRTNEELKSEREQRRNLCVKENESSKEISDLRRQVDIKNAEISSLREKCSEMKGEHSTQLVEKVREAELIERSKAERKVSELNDELSHLKEELTRTKATLESTERQISDVMVERTDKTKSIQDKELQLEKVMSQCSLAERKLNEADEGRRRAEEKWEKLYKEYDEVFQKLKSEQENHEKSKATSTEKDRELMSIQLSFQSVKSQLDHTKSDLDEVKVQRLNLKADLDVKTKEYENARDQLHSYKSTVSDYENRIGELIQEKTRVTSSALQFEDENAILKKSLESAEDEIRDTRNQISLLMEEKNEIKKLMKEIETKSRAENEKLIKQLKQTKQSLKEAEKSLLTIKSVDGRAARIAENMQKEVTSKRSLIDSLQTELSKTIDKLTDFERANKVLQNNLEEMELNLEELKISKKNLELELKELKKSEKGYKIAVGRLEKGLEKAAVKNSEAQTKITRQENDIAQLHINHNMMLMNKRTAAPVATPSEKALPGANLYQPNVMQHGGSVAQSMLAKVILNMASQQPSHQDGYSHHLPLSGAKSDLQKAIPQTEVGHEMTTDMCKLLTEVRDQLHKIERSENDLTRKRSHSKKKVRKSKHLEPSILELQSESYDFSLTPDMSSAFSASLLDSTTLGSTVKDQGSLEIKMAESTNDRLPSPVSDLLRNGKPVAQKSPVSRRILEQPLHDTSDSHLGATSESVMEIPATNPEVLKNAITNTAEDLCRQLQDRLEGLSRMGGKLQEQNKLTERMIKKQDAKLQKVRGGLKFR